MGQLLAEIDIVEPGNELLEDKMVHTCPMHELSRTKSVAKLLKIEHLRDNSNRPHWQFMA